MKYRVIEKILEDKSVFFPQVQVKILWLFSKWRRIAVCTNFEGNIFLTDDFSHGYTTIEEAWNRTKEYEESLTQKRIKIHYGKSL